MSGVYQRNREVSEYKFFTQAIAIRVEVNKLNLAGGGVAQCNQARETIRAERPRHSGRAATQNGGLDGSKTK